MDELGNRTTNEAVQSAANALAVAKLQEVMEDLGATNPDVIEIKEPLPFSDTKQLAVLGHLLTNDMFFVQAAGRLRPECFLDGLDKRLFKEKVDFYTKERKIPSTEEIKSLPTVMSDDARVRNRLHSRIDLAVATCKQFHLEPILPEITEWMQCQIYKTLTERGVSLFKKRPRDSFQLARDMVKQLDEATFEPDREEKFGNLDEFMRQRKADLSNALTFGIKTFDKFLTPECADGALLRGDTTIYLAPTNVGKSTAMISTIRANLRKGFNEYIGEWLRGKRPDPREFNGKHILWITHEGTPEDLKKMLYCAMMNRSKEGFFNIFDTAEGRMIVDFTLPWLETYLTYIPMNQPGLTVEEVSTVIRRRYESRAARNAGRGYDMVVDDYPAKLITKLAHGGQMQTRHIDHYVYNYFVQLALEYKFHSLLAIQTNREGARVNRHEDGTKDRLLTMEDVSESYGTMQIATNVISINRDPKAEQNDRVTFFQCKSRSNKKGWAICCRSNYGHGISHSDELGGVAYRGSSSMSERIDDYLAQAHDMVLAEGMA